MTFILGKSCSRDKRTINKCLSHEVQLLLLDISEMIIMINKCFKIIQLRFLKSWSGQNNSRDVSKHRVTNTFECRISCFKYRHSFNKFTISLPFIYFLIILVQYAHVFTYICRSTYSNLQSGGSKFASILM